MELPCKKQDFIEQISDVKNLMQFTPNLQSLEIVENNDGITVTKEKLKILNKIFEQSSRHEITNNSWKIEILSGPMKGTKVSLKIEESEIGTKISGSGNLKISLKYRFLQPLINKKYKTVLTAILYKINNKIFNY